MPVQKPYFQHVVDTGLHFQQIKWFGNEILGARLQGPLLVIGLRCDGQNRRVTVGFDGFEALHDLESIHARHLQVQQNQVVSQRLMQAAYLS